MRLHRPEHGDRILDVGCGFGDTTRRLAELAGPEWSAVGVDASPRFIDAASREAQEEGVDNVRFAVADVQTAALRDRFNLAFSRFGTMFFANPVAALSDVRESLAPGGRLVMVVWRAKLENDWLYRAQTITERFLSKPEEYEEPTCGPGPFSMANADTTSGILVSAGFESISLRRCDMPISIGANVNQAVEAVMSLGPGGEILRLAGERAAHLHRPIAEALHDGLSKWAGPNSAPGIDLDHLGRRARQDLKLNVARAARRRSIRTSKSMAQGALTSSHARRAATPQQWWACPAGEKPGSSKQRNGSKRKSRPGLRNLLLGTDEMQV